MLKAISRASFQRSRPTTWKHYPRFQNSGKGFLNTSNGLGRTPPGTPCLVIRALGFVRSGSAHPLLFIQILARNIILRHLVRANFPLVSVPRRLPRPSPPRPRTRFLPRATRPHSPNRHLERWTIPANLPIARPTALPVSPVRMPRYPRFDFSPEPVS